MAEALRIEFLRRDGGTQPRAVLNPETVADYAEAIRAGAEFPPVIVFYDGTDHWLADGFHRAAAHEAAEQVCVPAEIRAGTRRDAVLFACGANANHGLRRSNEDKRRAVILLLEDAEWSQWSDREIARRAHVGHPLVAELRRVTGSSSSERSFTTKHGTMARMDTAAIGKRAADVATIRSMPVEALYQVTAEVHRRKQDAKKERREERERELGE